MAWAVTGDLADDRRRGGVGAVLELGGPPHRAGPRTAHQPPTPAQPRAARWAHRVHVPVPVAGGLVLRRPAVSVGRPRAVRHRHRRAAPAVVDHAAARSCRRATAVPERVAPTRRPGRVPRPVRRHRRHGRTARHRRRTRDRDLADAARRIGNRSTRLAARRAHGVIGARRAHRRGRRPAEHGDQPRRVDRDRTRGRGADVRARLLRTSRTSPTTPTSPIGSSRNPRCN